MKPRRHPPGYDAVYRVMIWIGRSLFGGLRLRFRIRGMEHIPTDGAAVVAITHFGYLEFALTEYAIWLRRHRFTRFMATQSTWRHPVAGPLMRAMHHVPVDRSSGAGAEGYRQSVDALRSGELLGIFPEGGVSTTWTVRELKTGAVRLAQEAEVPLIPVGLWGGHRIITRGHGLSLRRAFRVPVHIECGEPFAIGADESPQDATQRLRVVMQDLVDRAREGYPSSPEDADAWWQPQE